MRWAVFSRPSAACLLGKDSMFYSKHSAHCPSDDSNFSDALFGEQDYVKHLHEQVAVLGLEEWVL